MFFVDNCLTFVKHCLKYQKHKNFSFSLINVRYYCVSASGDAARGRAPVEEEQQLAQKQQNKQMQHLQQQQLQLQRVLHVAVIGVPNAGKSTFINNLINHRVCPTSCKVHTTRKANKAIYTTGYTQLVFYDTPGLVTPSQIKKHNLEQSFNTAYHDAIQHADVIAVMHDVSNVWTRSELHSTVLSTLQAYSTVPSILILNKIDMLRSKRMLLHLIKTLTNEQLSNGTAATFDTTKEHSGSWSNFNDVFLVSSITGNGLSDIHQYFVNFAKARPWQYASETFTDEAPEDLIVESVRARLLDYLPQEIPYTLKSVMEYYSVENGTIYASVLVICPSSRIERLICGESKGKLRQITERVTSDLVETFGKPISLTIATSNKKKSA